MAHEIELNDSLFVTRTPAWHGLGIVVQEALSSEDALRIAGLDWEVEQAPVYRQEVTGFGIKTTEIDNYRVNFRSDDNTVLGIVGDGYRIVQNREAFAFTDHLIGQGARYESAGSLRGGRRVWMLARMPETKILGDKIEPYLVFSNGHDGRNAVKVAITPIRVVCMNTLNLALGTATRAWSTNHQGDIQGKLQDAERTLQLSANYMTALAEDAERLVEIAVTKNMLAELTVDLLPLPKDQKRHDLVRNMRKEFMYRYQSAPDLERFRGTGWGFINAVADFADHRQPKRKTASYDSHQFERVIGGHVLLDRAVELLKAA